MAGYRGRRGWTRPEWMDRAVCRSAPPGLFFTEDTYTIAKRYCAACPVEEQCLQHAIEFNEEHDVWGRMSPAERKRHKRRLTIRAQIIERRAT